MLEESGEGLSNLCVLELCDVSRCRGAPCGSGEALCWGCVKGWLLGAG